MNLLAIDSAASVLSVAAAAGDKIFYSETDAGMRQSEIVIKCIDEQIRNAALNPCDLNGIICMGGPGSFTGLRIGYSAAKGLALSLSIPFVPVPTLDCIAKSKEQLIINREQKEEKIILAVMQARKSSWFYAFYRGKERLTPDRETSNNQITDEINYYLTNGYEIIVTGPGADSFYNNLPQTIRTAISLNCGKRGYAKEQLAIAKEKNIFCNDNSGFLYSGPEYIRKSDAELNLDQMPDVRYLCCQKALLLA